MISWFSSQNQSWFLPCPLQEKLRQRDIPVGVCEGFKVVDLRSGAGAMLELRVEGVAYRGFLDVGVVPFGLIGYSCLKQLRLGVELKQTAQQKKKFHEQHGGGGQHRALMPVPRWVLNCRVALQGALIWKIPQAKRGNMRHFLTLRQAKVRRLGSADVSLY
jgi:hypothetical protein